MEEQKRATTFVVARSRGALCRRDGSGGWCGSVRGGWGSLPVSGGVGRIRKGKTRHVFRRASFSVTNRAGLPFLGSPSVSSLSIAFSSIEGEVDGPTSLRRGEGHHVGLMSVVKSEVGSEVWVVVVVG
jgi:hypothetical protein